MNSLELLTDIYKPLKVTINKGVKVFDTTSGKYIIKNRRKSNISDTFNYLKSRNFGNIPKLVDIRDDVNVYEYIDSVDTPLEQKGEDLIRIIASLHNKTSYFKEVSEDKYKEIFDNINNNISYLKKFYNTLFDSYIVNEFLNPYEYLFVRNYSSINNTFSFIESELGSWYNLVKDKTKQRVCMLHNNVSLDHFLKGENDYLVSWDNSRVDTPVWDVVKFYKKHYYDLEFSTILNIYLNDFELNEDELKLLYILMALPDEVKLSDDIYRNTENIRVMLDYIFKTEKLIRPYYSKEEENK